MRFGTPVYLNLFFHFFALVLRLRATLRFATQHAMPPEFGRQCGTECLNTRLPLPTLLCAIYSVKLIKMIALVRMQSAAQRKNSTEIAIQGFLTLGSTLPLPTPVCAAKNVFYYIC